MFELLDSTKEQLCSTSPGDPAVSWIQKPICHTEGLVTVALQRYSPWRRQSKGTIQVAARDTIHVPLPFIAPTHAVQSCTRPSPAKTVLSLGCTQLPASFYLSKTSNLPLQTLTHSTSRYLLTGTQDFKDCFFLPPFKQKRTAPTLVPVLSHIYSKSEGHIHMECLAITGLQ